MSVTRLILARLAVVALLAAPLAVEAQPAGKVYRIGVMLGERSPSVFKSNPAPEHLALQQGLRDLGWLEGQNLSFVAPSSAEGKLERLPAVASELVRHDVDLILAYNTPQALAAQRATTTIPIVMMFVADPVGTGLVRSLARPGGNVTGPSMASTDLYAKRLELLQAVIPQASRVAVIRSPLFASGRSWREIQVAAQALHVTLLPFDLHKPDELELERAFARITQARTQALVVFGSPWDLSDPRRFFELAVKHRLPAMYGGRQFVAAGGLMSYGANLFDTARRVAVYVDKILKGAKPADLPVEEPTTFELLINGKTAKRLGLTIPPSVLARADQIIE